MKLAKPSSDNWNLKTSASLLVCKNAKRHLEQNENNTTILWLKCHIILNTQRSQLRQAHYNSLSLNSFTVTSFQKFPIGFEQETLMNEQAPQSS